MVHGVPPFPFVRESLQALQSQADVVAVSATPLAVLVREWEESGLTQYARVLAGQEMGTKQQQLAQADRGKYSPNHILMIGDALGDMEAARSNGALFCPINHGHEEAAWKRFYQEGMRKFLSGQYAGAYEAALIAEFEQLLPSVPPWKR